ncbi:ethanolamine ammonia-lyase subunit EutC [Terriglobus albidus]|uniref:ethanolamine ammonia-lyase subunit EutC n=1 Tax=Terriglobus albidus TaxID=1592106 RepID=UPI0021DF8FA4|nr:ethanolamine ammonia-lyase subunit EutC [Terriglobus albidus]
MTRALSTLRRYTPARVALPSTGVSLATSEVLAFQLAHAQARDAVHVPLHLPSLALRLQQEAGVSTVLQLTTAAQDRAQYLRNPGLGRKLSDASRTQLVRGSYDLTIVVADGLSALAIERHAVETLAALLPMLAEWALAPIVLLTQARVAVGDEIGEALGAKCSLVLIGERPGLSSADSLGAYLTWDPCVGKTDADRNCISNIRDGGLEPKAAAEKIFWYLQEARRLGLSGTGLKDGGIVELLNR